MPLQLRLPRLSDFTVIVRGTLVALALLAAGTAAMADRIAPPTAQSTRYEGPIAAIAAIIQARVHHTDGRPIGPVVGNAPQ